MLRRRGRRKRCGRRVGAIFLQLLLLVSVSTAAYAMIVFSLSFQAMTPATLLASTSLIVAQDFAESNREFPLPPRNRSNAPASLAYRHAVVESIRGPNFFDDPRVNPAIVILCYNRADYLQSVLDRGWTCCQAGVKPGST